MPTQHTLPPKGAFIDLSQPLIPGKVFACDGHPQYNACCIGSLAKGDLANVHSLTLGTHTGTHVDAPWHFVDDAIKVDEIDLSLLTAAPAVVADLRHKKKAERITWDDLKKYEGRMGKGVALLLCMGWSREWLKPHYFEHPYIDAETAKKILATGVKVIGVDAMSPDQVTAETGDVGHAHRVILGNGGVIVENLNGVEEILDRGINDEDLRISVVPLRLVACDGSPIRAVAWSKRDVA